MTFLGIDAGTTCTKGVLFSEAGEILTVESRDNALLESNGYAYVDVGRIRDNVRDILRSISASYRVSTVAFTSLGESFVALDGEDQPVFPTMLYSDPRGSLEAEETAEAMGEENVFRLTGVMPQSMYSLYKLLFWKKTRPEDFARVRRVFLVGDYLGWMLTGRAAIDRSLAARTGALDVDSCTFSPEMLSLCGLSPDMLPKVCPAGTPLGRISPDAAAELGVDPDCLVVIGSHDQVCSALGSGGIAPGVGVDGMGTVECIVGVFEGQVSDPGMGRMGYPCVPFIKDGAYATYLLNYTCGGLMKWFKSTLMRDVFPDGEDSFYAWCEKGIDTAHASSLLLLPYLRGAATPVNDIMAKGAVVGLTAETTTADLYRAILEGTSYEMRLNLEVMGNYGMKLSRLIATGGCARSDAWLQIKANILGLPVTRVSNVEAGCCGAAMLGAVAAGAFPSLDEAAAVFVKEGKTFLPHPDPSFDRQYAKYKRLYEAVKELY